METNKEVSADSAVTLSSPEIAALASTLKPASLPSEQGGSGISQPVQEEFKADYTEEEVSEFLTLLADFMHAITDKDHWILTKDERELLGRRGKRALALVLKIEPKWLTIGTFLSALGIVYGPRFAKDFKDWRDKKKSREQKKEDKKEE